MRSLLAVVTLLAAYACPEPSMLSDTPNDWPPFVGEEGEGPWVETTGDDFNICVHIESRGGLVCFKQSMCGTDSQCEGVE